MLKNAQSVSIPNTTWPIDSNGVGEQRLLRNRTYVPEMPRELVLGFQGARASDSGMDVIPSLRR